MKVNVLSKKLIKPCFPTPDKLRTYKISLTDEIVYPVNVSAILFYSSTEATKNPNILNQLEESLAQILPQFYPLAGRYVKQNRLVDCNDSGAEFVEAEADLALFDLIGSPVMDDDTIFHLLPCETGDVDEITDPILFIQVTKFECGGLAIGVSISHRIFDASSFTTFIAAWAYANSSEGKNRSINPSFDSASLFPGKNLAPVIARESRTTDPSFVFKRCLFNKSAITSLRDKIKLKSSSSCTSHSLSRVRVVSAVVAKALNAVDRVKHGGKSRGSLILLAVNIRERIVPPLPKHSCGNYVAPCLTIIDEAHIDYMDVQDYFNTISDAMKKTISDCAELLSRGDEGGKSILIDPVMKMVEIAINGHLNVVCFTDWSKFGFYEVDFGWGKPICASVGRPFGENLVVLMDNKEGDGIEAWVCLHKKTMPYFEQNEDIKLFTAQTDI